MEESNVEVGSKRAREPTDDELVTLRNPSHHVMVTASFCCHALFFAVLLCVTMCYQGF